MNNAAYIALNYIYLLLGVSNGQCFPPPLSKKEETEEFYKMAEGDDPFLFLPLHRIRSFPWYARGFRVR